MGSSRVRSGTSISLGWTKIEEKSPEFFFLNEPCKFFK